MVVNELQQPIYQSKRNILPSLSLLVKTYRLNNSQYFSYEGLCVFYWWLPVFLQEALSCLAPEAQSKESCVLESPQTRQFYN